MSDNRKYYYLKLKENYFITLTRTLSCCWKVCRTVSSIPTFS